MIDRNHHHNGQDCLTRWIVCPGGCVNHMQDEQHTADCRYPIPVAARFDEALNAPDHSEGNRSWVERMKQDAKQDARGTKTDNFYKGLSIPPIDINKTPAGLTAFELIRQSDESGVSGTGLVLQGIIFNDGTVAVRWCTENAGQSSTVYGPENGTSGWQKFLSIHVLSHPTNGTVIVFYPAISSLSQYQWEQPIVSEKQQTIDEAWNDLKKLIDRQRPPIGNRVVFPKIPNIDFRKRY